ncbi:MAG: cation:proton antiporter, partial [Floccifex sp.]
LLENLPIPFSGYISIMAMGLAIHNTSSSCSSLNHLYSQTWNIAQIFLFVLVGASVNLSVAFDYGWISVLFLFVVLFIRILGVFVCLIKTPLNQKERFFTAVSYCPKATVQAAIGSVPLAMGLSHGEFILAISVLSILVSAPLGSILMDLFDKKCLEKECL